MINFLNQHIYIFLSLAFAVSSQLIIKWKMLDNSYNDFSSWQDRYLFAFSMLINPYIISALIFSVLAGVTWMIAMTKFELSYAYPFTVFSLIFITLFSIIFFEEQVNAHKIIGIILIAIGIFSISRGS
jgi:multidrug transporter EmrE-like cation transporter